MALLFILAAVIMILQFNAWAQPVSHSKCRFSQTYSWDDLVRNSTKFELDVFYWEGQFHQNGIGYNVNNGVTLGGCALDPINGLVNARQGRRHSSASNEALQIMVYSHALQGNQLALRFVYPWEPEDAPEFAAAVLSQKLETYRLFNSTYPGYGGLLPLIIVNETAIHPAQDWIGRVPALDNGKLLWAVYGLVDVLNRSVRPELKQLGDSWQQWLDEVSRHIAKIFYRGHGHICAVASLIQNLTPTSSEQQYSCEEQSKLNDPFEGELFTWWLHFHGGLSDTEKILIWELKRPQLLAVNYTGSVVDTLYDTRSSVNYANRSIEPPSIVPITIQQGNWFSSLEQWKLLEMPYLDVGIVRRVYKNAERVRTCNSNIMGKNPGMFASVNDITDWTTGSVQRYISDAGVPSAARIQQQKLDVVTPYSVFPTILFNRTVGLIWYKNMLDARGMQNPYGSSESLRRDGTAVSAFVSWNSKITTIVALLGGIGNVVRQKMVNDGIYNEFIDILHHEYNRVFGDPCGQPLVGEDVELCLPDFEVPVRNVTDFTMCS